MVTQNTKLPCIFSKDVILSYVWIYYACIYTHTYMYIVFIWGYFVLWDLGAKLSGCVFVCCSIATAAVQTEDRRHHGSLKWGQTCRWKHLIEILWSCGSHFHSRAAAKPFKSFLCVPTYGFQSAWKLSIRYRVSYLFHKKQPNSFLGINGQQETLEMDYGYLPEL